MVLGHIGRSCERGRSRGGDAYVHATHIVRLSAYVRKQSRVGPSLELFKMRKLESERDACRRTEQVWMEVEIAQLSSISKADFTSRPGVNRHEHALQHDSVPESSHRAKKCVCMGVCR